MAPLSSPWRQFLLDLDLPTDFGRSLSRTSRRRSGRRGHPQALPWKRLLRNPRVGSWLVAATGGTALLLWSWKLCLATGVGVGVMMAVYALQRQDWQRWLRQVQGWLRGPQQLLVVSVGAGGAAMLGTYMAASVWADGSPWLATSISLEGLGLLALLLLVVLQWTERQGDRLEDSLDQALDDLGHPQPLKRLKAVRQLDRLQAGRQLSPAQAATAQRALQLLLGQETETEIREAVLDCFPQGLPLSLHQRR